MPDMPDAAHPAGNLHLLAALDREATARLTVTACTASTREPESPETEYGTAR